MRPLREDEQALCDTLLAQDLVSRAQLSYALRQHALSEGSLAGLLVRLGLVPDTAMAAVVAVARGLPLTDALPPELPEAAALALCRREICQSLGILPLRVDGGTLLAWLGEPDGDRAAAWVSRRLGLDLVCHQGPFKAVAEAIDAAYVNDRRNARALFELECQRLQRDEGGELGMEVLLRALITLAHAERASDIHLAPDEISMLLSLRIDGVLIPVMAMPRRLLRLVSAIKVAAGMDIGDSLRPQGGRFSFSEESLDLDVRVSTAITPAGENVVMRLLPTGALVSGLDELGFFPEHLPLLKRLFDQPYGIALFAGPTGSGKTTSMFAGLKPHCMSGKSILTVEDPIEYNLPAACQTQVNRRAGYTFDSAIRHFLRHDPDIMLVGEIRDTETAEAALRAAETGHVVLSTLHVNTAFSVPLRLQSLGVSPLALSEALIGVVTQRLMRRLCPHCKVVDPEGDAALASLLKPWIGAETPRLYRAMGCEHCAETGYRGRVPVYEILRVDEGLSRWIAAGGGRHGTEGLLCADNHVSMQDLALRRLASGETSREEYARVFGAAPDAAVA